MKHSFFAIALIVTTFSSAQRTIVTKVGNLPENTPMSLSTFETIKLQTPDTAAGMPLMMAISKRKSDRQFESKNLSLKHLSEILWVANGVNRANGKRTVPSSMARYPLQTYAVLSNGIYFYNVQKHQLEPVVQGNFQKLAGRQSFVETAPLNLLYIAKARSENDDFGAAYMDSGYCGQNVYLYCASEGLKTVVRASAQEAELLKVMGLETGYKFILAQSVGY